MTFPRDLFRFLYWIFFKPFSLRTWINQLDPTIGNTATLLTRRHERTALPLRNLALFYILFAPLLGLSTGLILSQLDMSVNWLKLLLFLVVGIIMSTSFNIGFCIAFLLPFSVLIAIWSSTAFTPALGILFSLLLGLAYGLNANSARWGLIAGVAYGVVIGLIANPLGGLVIGAAFLAGYFRIIFYVIEVPLAWTLGTRALTGDALRLWRFQPVRWDELIWFPLPGLDQHLRALKQQNGPAAQDAIRQVRESFRQRWAAEQSKIKT
jgi:hypothetical protein